MHDQHVNQEPPGGWQIMPTSLYFSHSSLRAAMPDHAGGRAPDELFSLNKSFSRDNMMSDGQPSWQAGAPPQKHR
jgi:hypothetical protein